jgi:hypothetical protein
MKIVRFRKGGNGFLAVLGGRVFHLSKIKQVEKLLAWLKISPDGKAVLPPVKTIPAGLNSRPAPVIPESRPASVQDKPATLVNTSPRRGPPGKPAAITIAGSSSLLPGHYGELGFNDLPKR